MATVTVRWPDGTELTHPLDRDAITFGSASDNDVVLEVRGINGHRDKMGFVFDHDDIKTAA